MKKSLKLLPLLLGGSIVLAGCNDFSANWPNELPSPGAAEIDTPWSDYSNPCTSITFAKGQTNVDILKGETFTYSYTVEPRDFNKSSLVWKSDNPEVATVADGVLTAVGGGKANISLSSGDVSARSLVNVIVPITDFSVNNKDITLDMQGTAQIECTLEPTDTTQNKMSYSVEPAGVVEVSDKGVITALGVVGDAQISVTNEGLNKVETINVHAKDLWNYVDTIFLTGPEKIEVTSVDYLNSEVIGVDPTKDPSTLANNKVEYSVKEGSEEFISINSESGEITGLEPGNATLVASILDERSGNTVTNEFNVEVYEVYATAIELTDSETIELDNDKNTVHQLDYKYTLSDQSADKPSRGNISYATSDKNVVMVSDSGLIEVVGPGSATVTIKDLTYNVEDSIDVHTTIYAKSVTLSANGEFYLDETIEITANIVPAITTDELVWEYNESSEHTFVEDGNKLIVTCNNIDNPITVKASVGSVNSNELTLTPKEREVVFENGKTYIVGSSNYKSGVSKDVDGGSWNNAKYAFVMTDKTGNPNAKYEYKAVIDFRANDEWKIRENVDTWREILSLNGRYKTDEGAFAKGQMDVIGGDSPNVVVKEAGKYDVYFAYYDDVEGGWYEVYVEEHGMKISTTDVHAKLTSPATVSTITASNWDGTLCVSDVDETFINVSLDQLTGNISITPLKLGKTTFTVSDDLKDITINVEIKEGSDAKLTEYYIRGDAVKTWDVDDEYALRVSEDSQNIGEIKDVYLNVGEFKIANADWSKSWGYMSLEDGGASSKFTYGNSNDNIKCSVAGYYNIYLKQNSLYIENANGDDPVTFMWGIAGSGTGWKLDTDHPFVESTKEGSAEFTYKLNGFEFAKDATWKVTNSKGEWISNIEGKVGIDLTASTAGAFSISNGDIKVETAGVYNITLNIFKDGEKVGSDWISGMQIIAIKQEGPVTPKIEFDVTEPKVLVDNELTINYVVTGEVGDITPSIASDGEAYIDIVSYDNTKVVVEGLAEGTATLNVHGSKGVDASIQIECITESPVPVIGDHVMWGKFNGSTEWTGLPMTQTPDKTTQYEYTGDFKAGDVFAVHMSGDPGDANTWFHFADIKSGCTAPVEADGENIKFTKDGNYSIYADSNLNDKGIWISRNVAPATMHVDNLEPVVMNLNEDVDYLEYKVIGASLTNGNWFHFEYDGAKIGYNDIKTGSPAGVTSDKAGNIQVTASGLYDIYLEPNGAEGKLYIAPHKDVIPDYVVHVMIGEEWSDLEMTKKGDSTEYMIQREFDVDEIFSVHYSGDTWFHYDDVKEGCKNLVQDVDDENHNIQFKEKAVYIIYADTDGIWISKAKVDFKTASPQVQVGSTLDLSVDTYEFTGITYESSDEAKLTVESSTANTVTVKGVAEGSATVTAKLNGYILGSTVVEVTTDKPVPKDVTVTFTINYGTNDGEGVYIVGDFCNWKASQGIRGTWTAGNNWVFTIKVQAGTTWKFKFVINSYNDPTDDAYRWEADPDRTYTFNADGSETFSWKS